MKLECRLTIRSEHRRSFVRETEISHSCAVVQIYGTAQWLDTARALPETPSRVFDGKTLSHFQHLFYTTAGNLNTQS